MFRTYSFCSAQFFWTNVQLPKNYYRAHVHLKGKSKYPLIVSWPACLHTSRVHPITATSSCNFISHYKHHLSYLFYTTSTTVNKSPCLPAHRLRSTSRQHDSKHAEYKTHILHNFSYSCLIKIDLKRLMLSHLCDVLSMSMLLTQSSSVTSHEHSTRSDIAQRHVILVSLYSYTCTCTCPCTCTCTCTIYTDTTPEFQANRTVPMPTQASI